MVGDNDVEICALVGDASQNRRVDRRDAKVVVDHSSQALDQMSGNYVLDLNLDGTIDLGDSQVVKMNRGHMVP